MEELDVLWKILSIKHEEFLDADSLEKLQIKKLSKIAESASKSKHYQNFFQDAGIKPSELLKNLDAFPLTRKDAVRSNPDDFVPYGIDTQKLKAVHTSGSTGTPTKIYVDEDVLYYRHALKYAFETSLGRSPFELFAHIFFHDFDANSLLSRSGLFPKLFLQVSDSEESNFKKIRQRRPLVLRGYPSVLASLGRMNSNSDITFKSIISGGELLSEDVRKDIEESFSCKVFNHYGCMEASTIARECPEERKLHVNSYSSIVEIVDGNGKPKKNGIGEIAITPLFNDKMPLLRYCLGDHARWGKECSCGRSLPVLETLDGRIDDTITLPSGRVRPGMSIHPMVSSRSIVSYQIVQESCERIIFRYVPFADTISKDLESSIRKRIINGCLGEEVSVEFEAVDQIKKGRTGKIRTIISKVKGLNPQ